MEPEFSGLSERERVARCLELAQSETDRANSSRDAVARNLHLSLAECWRSMAKQFESLSSLRTELDGKARDLRDMRSTGAPQRSEFGLPTRLKGFAT